MVQCQIHLFLGTDVHLILTDCYSVDALNSSLTFQIIVVSWSSVCLIVFSSLGLTVNGFCYFLVMISSTLFYIICTTLIIANTAESQHLNVSPEKNETGENSVSQQKLPDSEIRPDYLRAVNAIDTIVLCELFFSLRKLISLIIKHEPS